MKKILCQIDLNTIDESRVRNNEYTKSDGTKISERLYEFEVVELKDEKKKQIKSGDGWVLIKTHFICEAQSKEERSMKIPTVYVGEGKQFIYTNDESNNDYSADSEIEALANTEPSSIPF